MQLYIPSTHTTNKIDPFDTFEQAVKMQDQLASIEQNKREISYLSNITDNLRDLMSCCEHFSDPQLMSLIDDNNQLSDQLGIDLRSSDADVVMESIGSKLKDAVQWLIDKVKDLINKILSLFKKRNTDKTTEKKIKELKEQEKKLVVEKRERDTAFKNIILTNGIKSKDGKEALEWMKETSSKLGDLVKKNDSLDFEVLKSEVDDMVGEWKGDRRFLKAVPIYTQLKVSDSMVDAKDIKGCIKTINVTYDVITSIDLNVVSYTGKLKDSINRNNKKLKQLDATRDTGAIQELKSDTQARQLLVLLTKGISDMGTQLNYILSSMSDVILDFTMKQEVYSKKDKS